ncbi:MAG: PEP-CTERM sorting domain-containing protein [Planctomycetota bacterium]
MKTHIATAAMVAAAGIAASAAWAQPIIAPGVYLASNHPDAALTEPGYGLRLDELVDVTSEHDNFTFDFNHVESQVLFTFDGSSITIAGEAFGGRDVGTDYAVEPLTGVYSFSFKYDVGVQQAPGDDDLLVVPDANGDNTGSITTPTGLTIDLFDFVRGGFSFRMGDGDDDTGHRGWDGLSGWGWLAYEDGHEMSSDWIFTLSPTPVPAPASVALVGLAGLMASKRRRG